MLGFSSLQEAEGGHRPLRSPPGLSYSFRSQLTTNDNMTDWLHFLLEADNAQGEVRGRVTTQELTVASVQCSGRTTRSPHTNPLNHSTLQSRLQPQLQPITTNYS